MQNVGEAFSYQFKDEKWINKFVIGSLLVAASFFIIPTPFLVGYMVANMRSVMNKQKALPEFKNLGTMYIDGLKYIGASLGYAIPIILLSMLMIVGIIITAIFNESDIAPIILIIVMIVMYGFIALYALIMQFISPVIYIKYANQEPLRELYNFKEIFKFIKNNIVNIIVCIALTWAAGMIINIGMFAFIIGILPATFYTMTIMAYLYGQLYLQSKKV